MSPKTGFEIASNEYWLFVEVDKAGTYVAFRSGIFMIDKNSLNIQYSIENIQLWVEWKNIPI